MRRAAVAVAIALAASSVASAYYHFVRFNNRIGPFIPVVEKFDVAALVNKTVPFFIGDLNAVQLNSSDSQTALISQIRAAARVWNDVESSDLRVAFGGFRTDGLPMNSPSVEIEFDEVPPGVVAQGGPVVRSDFNGQFVPIMRSVVTVTRDLSNRPSFGEAFFATMVHEIGHALGLQHTFTSGVMSTVFTRTTSRGRPLTADDVAGLAVLYPTRQFGVSTGSISGRVLLNGQGVNLASVVAIAPNGPAISAMTNPDGTYRIDGLVPGQYLVYAHPLPPALQGQASPGDLILPLDADRRSLAVGPVFESQFYPGTQNPQTAFPLTVNAGVNNENVNFLVRGRSALQIHTIQTYAFPGNFAVRPPYLNSSSSRPFLVASGVGLTENRNPRPGISVGVLGSGASIALRPYAPEPVNFVQADIDVRSFTFGNEGPRHLVFQFSSPLLNDFYVLPSAFFQAAGNPPSVTGVTASSEGATRLAVLQGANFADSRVFFDGVAATVRSVEPGRLVVVPPPAPPQHRAAVVVLNSDGQSSLFLQSEPLFYTYETDALSAAPAGGIQFSPSALPAGSEAMVEVTSNSPAVSFVDGQTRIAFGNADVLVRGAWVLAPNRMLVNVAVGRLAAIGVLNPVVANGLSIITQPGGFEVQPAGRVMTLASQLQTASGQTSVSAGQTAVLTVNNPASALSSGSITLTLNDRPVPVLAAQGTQITFQVPAGTPAGPAVLRLQAGTESSLPIVVVIDLAPPQILSVAGPFNQPVDSNRPARPGDLLVAQVASLADPGAAVNLNRVQARIGGIDVPLASVQWSGANHAVVFFLPATIPAGTQPLTVTVDGRNSNSFNLVVAR